MYLCDKRKTSLESAHRKAHLLQPGWETWKLVDHMIDVLVRKLPAKVALDWYDHKQKEQVGTMASEDVFGELMKFLKAKKDITKEYLHKQETSSDKSRTHSSYVTGHTFTIQHQR